MKSRNSSRNATQKRKWISSSIAAMAYLAGIREVESGNKTFLACDINVVEGPRDGASYRRFSCIIAGEKAREVVLSCEESLEQERPVLMGVLLRGFKPHIYEHTKGKYEGELDVSFQSSLMYIDWVRIDGQEVYKVLPEEKEQGQRLAIPAAHDDSPDDADQGRQDVAQSKRGGTASKGNSSGFRSQSDGRQSSRNGSFSARQF